MANALLWCSLVVVAVGAVPYPYYRDGGEEELIDLSSLGEKAFGLPKASSGVILSNWDPKTSNSFPEELGEYAQGDILFPPETKRNGLIAESTRWPNKIVPYVIEGNFASDAYSNLMAAFDNYHRHTCLKFVRRTNQNDYIAITNKNTGCWSSVGRIGGRQELNIQSPGCTVKKGTIEHELLHALGVMHEQSREDRDKYVIINYGNVKPGEEYNFNKASKGSTSAFGVNYDYESVMHYSDYAFSVNGKPTITSKVAGVRLGQREGLSRGDIQKINAMYKCSSPVFGEIGSIFSSIFGGK